jgi:predicted metalloprotease with PDZ domain
MPLVVLLVGLLVPGTWVHAQPSPLRYEILVEPVRQELRITGFVTGARAGTHRVFFPRTYQRAVTFFISDLTFFDGNGPLVYRQAEANSWEVAVEDEGYAFSYTLNPAGARVLADLAWGGAISQLNGHVAFLSGSMAFILPARIRLDHPIDLVWRVPPGWDVVTPWSTFGDSTRVSTVYSLVNNYFGAFAHSSTVSRRFKNLDLTLVWTGSDDIRGYPEALIAAGQVVGAGIDLFGGTAPMDDLTLMMRDTNPGDQYRASTEANTIEFNFREGLTFNAIWQRDRLRFLGLLAHEFIHTWDRRDEARALDFVQVPEWGDDSCWIREGITDYLSTLVLMRAGFISSEQLVNRIQMQSDRAREADPAGRISLLTACARFYDDTMSNRYAYNEGASVAFLLDLELRRQSNGVLSLPQFMKLFYEKRRYQEKSMASFMEDWRTYAPEALHDLDEVIARPQPVDLTASLAALDMERSGERWHVPGQSRFSWYFR